MTTPATPSFAEMLADREATAADAQRLRLIAENLHLFIEDSRGEDRSGFKMDLFKYISLASQAESLRQKIDEALLKYYQWTPNK